MPQPEATYGWENPLFLLRRYVETVAACQSGDHKKLTTVLWVWSTDLMNIPAALVFVWVFCS